MSSKIVHSPNCPAKEGSLDELLGRTPGRCNCHVSDRAKYPDAATVTAVRNAAVCPYCGSAQTIEDMDYRPPKDGETLECHNESCGRKFIVAEAYHAVFVTTKMVEEERHEEEYRAKTHQAYGDVKNAHPDWKHDQIWAEVVARVGRPTNFVPPPKAVAED